MADFADRAFWSGRSAPARDGDAEGQPLMEGDRNSTPAYPYGVRPVRRAALSHVSEHAAVRVVVETETGRYPVVAGSTASPDPRRHGQAAVGVAPCHSTWSPEDALIDGTI